MHTRKIAAGAAFPALIVKSLDGSEIDIMQPAEGTDWTLLVVYRGKHCPLCTKYLNALEGHIDALRETGVGVVAVSGDSAEQLAAHKEQLNVSFPLFYGLTVEQMQALGLYISIPRSEKETDHNFAEPGLFVINADGQAHVVDISNNPFVRPELDALVGGLAWIRNPENNYPIRGTYSW
ncbi:MAG: peroxiredoxin-like family protein [Pseudomonadota bacterium]